MAKIPHFGYVTERYTGAPIGNAVVRLIPKTEGVREPKPEVTKATGTFCFERVDEDADWTLTVYQPEGNVSRPQAVKTEAGTDRENPASYKVVVESKIINQPLGTVALGVLVVLLVAAMVFWLDRTGGPHLPQATGLLDASARLEVLVKDESVPLRAKQISEALTALDEAIPEMEAPPALVTELATAHREVTAMRLLLGPAAERPDAALAALGALDEEGLPPDWSKTVEATQTALTDPDKRRSAVKKLKTATSDIRAAAGYMAVLEAALPALDETAQQRPTADEDRTLFGERLAIVEDAVPAVARAEVTDRPVSASVFDWMIGPSLALTVLFWGFVGSLTRLIFIIQKYLRFGSFYQHGLYQHIGLLVAVPVLTAGFVKLASLVTITASTDLQLDFGNPQIMAVGAFLLALSPWSLWERLLGLSAGIAGTGGGGGDT